MAPILEIDGLSYTYPDGTPALSAVSFQVEQGECVGLVGPSGAGKSTLALCLVGLIFPQQGSATVMGKKVDKKGISHARKHIGLVFQNPDDQLFMPTLFDDVAFGLLQRGDSPEQVKKMAARALTDRRLEKLAKKFPGHLSGGQKRLAALATVMVMEPEVLILDEPSSNLDPRSRRALICQLDDLENTRLVLSHDLELILDLADRVVLMDEGVLVAQGEPQKIIGDPDLAAAHGLEVPHSLLPHRHDLIPHRAAGKKTS